MPDRVICQWDKDSASDAGFVKIDLLGLGMLSAVEECVDLIAESRRPVLLVEAKRSSRDPSPALRKFQLALDVPAVQLTEGGGGHRLLPNEHLRILVVPAHRWLSILP